MLTTAPVLLGPVLLGLGWNLGLLVGTAVMTTPVAGTTRAAPQGKVDVAIAATIAADGLISGLVVVRRHR
ncbi:hypothetical protein BCD48_28805 [Pseudofrankia sp. BMG5.36]|nr:hypothetical protein BCD48_28805 [Pseudofrankia sp. BMG5.36]